MIQAQIYREWGVAIVKGRAECLLALLEFEEPSGFNALGAQAPKEVGVVAAP